MPKTMMTKVQQSHRAAPGSFSERRQLDAFRQALGAPLRVLQQSSDESGKGEPFWYIDGGNGYVTVSPDGDSFWIGLRGSPMLVAWARAQLAIFSTIRRVGANSLLAEMAFLPDEREAAVLRQALALPLSRAVWLHPDRREARP